MCISIFGCRVRLSCLLVVLLFGAGSFSESTAGIVTGDKEQLVQSNNAFALALFRHLSGHSGNLAISPYGISIAMALPYAGARNDTEKQMAETLRFALQQGRLHPALNALRLWDEAGEERGYSFHVANALWAQEGIDFEEKFLDTAKRYYEAGPHEVNFAGSAESARDEINRWIENHTEYRIKELLGQGDLDAETVLVLTNALHFKGLWRFPFKRENTMKRTFHLHTGDAVEIPMMSCSGRFAMASEEGVTLLELPYQGDRLSMIIILPTNKDGLTAMERDLDQDRISDWIKGFQEQEVHALVPRFHLNSRLDLTKTLTAMGMSDAFDERADFSGISADGELFISRVVQQASIEVDEEGTAASVASGAVMRIKGGAVFNADHPFLYLVRDRHTGSMLFIGRVVNPSTN